MPPPGGVSVALPIFRADPEALRLAVASITAQTLRSLDIIFMLNGADPSTSTLARTLAHQDPRVRILELPQPNLAAALNAALKAAHHPLVARMDADDTCNPRRLALQAAFMAENPAVAALGTSFEGVKSGGELVGIERPPTNPAEIRWRLCLGNLFCHGSMMLRREAVLAAGGYDESLRFSQDYDLWLRLSRTHDLANLPDILYRYLAAPERRHRAQAASASAAMLNAWATLPPLPPGPVRDSITALLAAATWRNHESRAALASLESLLTTHGPSREGLLAWQWIAARAGRHTDLKLDILRRAAARLREADVKQIWLYGAGRHTAWLVDNADEVGAPIAGIIDDACAGAQRHGFTIVSPAAIPDDADVLLSSDAHEDTLWEASLTLRSRGVRVWRLYGTSYAPAAFSNSP